MNVLKQSKIEGIESLVLEGYGIRPICKLIGAAKQTVQGYRSRLLEKRGEILCSCGRFIGHSGFCNFRISTLPKRQAWRKQVMTDYSVTILVRTAGPRKPRIPKELQPAYLKWPYTINGKLPFYLEAINNLVPEGITEHMRAEICQELAMDYIKGKFALGDMEGIVSSYIKKVYRQYSALWHISLDSPMLRNSDFRLKDIITDKNMTRELRLQEDLT